MREIKFRAWDKINKKMDYDPYGDEFLCEGTPINSALNSEHFFSDKPDSFYSPLMQFTGLHDKNGKEIYENDLRGGTYFCGGEETNFIEQIVWDEGIAGFRWERIKGSKPDFMQTEVIGNIYEHSHLLDNTDTKV